MKSKLEDKIDKEILIDMAKIIGWFLVAGILLASYDIIFPTSCVMTKKVDQILHVEKGRNPQVTYKMTDGTLHQAEGGINIGESICVEYK